MTQDLLGRVALVTGATGLIGAHVADVLMARGATVVVHGLEADRVAASVARLEARGAAVHGVTADLAEPGAPESVVASAIDRFQRLDILVNNAGMTDTYGDVLSYPDVAIDRLLRVNLWAPLMAARAAALRMVARGRGGAIVNITSVGGSQRAHHLNVVYDVTKGGLDAMTRALATDLGPAGIRVNAVGPAEISHDPPEARGWDLPLRHGGTGEDVAEAVAFLVSDAARFITGQILYVDGGLMAQLRSPDAAAHGLSGAASQDGSGSEAGRSDRG